MTHLYLTLLTQQGRRALLRNLTFRERIPDEERERYERELTFEGGLLTTSGWSFYVRLPCRILVWSRAA